MNYNPADTESQGAPTSPDTDEEDHNAILLGVNLAENLDEEELIEISDQVLKGYEADLDSRSEWEDNLDDWIKLANQVREEKSYPWPKASNVKYPLLSTAAMQFAARAYPSLVPSNRSVVNCTVVGKDADGQKLERAMRVSKFMSYQVMSEIPGWEEDMDRMLMMLPVVGTVFKKTWYDKGDDKIYSQVILPKNVIVNYWTKCLPECERITEVIEMSRRKLKEKQLSGVFRDVELGDPIPPASNDNTSTGYTEQDETTPYVLLEQHMFFDLDDDGYAEPYIVTMERESKKILRMQARFNKEGVELDEKGKIKKITPIQMYTKFGFVPNPDGSFYDIGFGILLGPLNESVNTLINQLVDAGTISNLQSGFIGKGLRLKMGDNSFQPGEWKPVQATGDDLRKQIVPLPTKEPSNVLFQLMGTLITSGKELASVAEIFVGKMPGQNTPATTTMASIEQGMKVFTAVYKRIFRSLSEEFDKIFDLNKLYIDPNHVVEVLDMQIGPDDFNRSDCDIAPGADPTAMSQTEKLVKAQGLVEMMQIFGQLLDPIQVASRVLEAQEQPNWQQLFSQQVQQTGQVPPPPPDPKILALQAKMQADQQNMALKTQQQQQQMELDARSKEQEMMQAAQEHAMNMQFMQEEHQQKAVSELQNAQVKIAAAHAQGQQKMVQGEQQHQQSMQQAKEKATLTQSQGTSSKSGNKTQSQSRSKQH